MEFAFAGIVLFVFHCRVHQALQVKMDNDNLLIAIITIITVPVATKRHRIGNNKEYRKY